MKLLLVLISTVALLGLTRADSFTDPSENVTTNYDRLLEVDSSISKLQVQLVKADTLSAEILAITTKDEVWQVNTKFRNLISLVIYFDGREKLADIEQWIFDHRPASLTLNDVKIGIRRAADYLQQCQKDAERSNQRRLNALAESTIENKKSELSNALNNFRWSLESLGKAREQLKGAIYDFKTFLTEV